MYLIFDATGAGKVKSFKASVEEIHNWPRLLHLSWIMLDEKILSRSKIMIVSLNQRAID